MTTTTTTQTLVPENTKRRWLALMLSPITGMVHFVAVYLLDEASCNLYFLRTLLFGVPRLVSLLVAITVLALLLILYGGYLGWQIWQASGGQADTEVAGEEEVAARDRFIGVSSLLLSGMFAVLALGVGVAVVVLDPC